MDLKIILFLACSAVIILVSRRSLFHPKSHGFPRFFAWEAMLALILWNIGDWFRDAFSPLQIFSWILLLLAVWVVAESAILFFAGKPHHSRQDEVLMGFEKTTRLVTTRIYKYIRHPMYTSLILVTWGAFLKNIDAVSIALAVFATLMLVFTAFREEQENIAWFGEEYRQYMKVSKKFIPFIF